MADVFDVEKYLDEQASRPVENLEKNDKRDEKEKQEGDKNKPNGEERERDRDRDRDRPRDRDRERDRDRDRDRRDRRRDSRDRRRHRSSSPSSRSRSKDRKRHRSRRDSRSRSNSRMRDSRERRRDRDRTRDRGRESSSGRIKEEKEKPRDRSAERKEEVNPERTAAEREELRRKREMDDLTKDQRTIFVSQLTKKVVEADLEKFFGEIGKVKSVIMLRDRITDAHKGFAYVEMAELEAIPKCLLFNNVVPNFQKFPILVKPSEAEKNFIAKKDPFIIKNVVEQAGPDTRIYLGNIHVGLDENALKAVLEQFGPVESVKLHRDHLGNSKGFAFVKFIGADSAKLAMTTLPGFELAGRPLKVGPVTDGKAIGLSVGQMMPGMSTGTDEVVNWKLDADEGGAGLPMNANTRMMLMAKLAEKAGIQVPAPVSFPVASTATATVGNNAAAERPVITGTPSRFVLISNMFDPLTETEPNWDRDIKEDVSEECTNFGQVANCYVEKRKPGGLVYIEMRQVDAAVKVANALNGRYFAKRLIRCSYLDERTFIEAIR